MGTGPRAALILKIFRAHDPPTSVIGFLTIGANEDPVGSVVYGLPVLDRVHNVGLYLDEGVVALSAAETSSEREAATARLLEANVPLISAIDPSAHVHESAEVGPGSVVSACVVVAAGARLGRSVWVEAGTIIDHHTRIGDYTTIGTGCVIGPACRIGEGVELGMGAHLRDDVLVGARAQVGYSSLVLTDVPAGTAVAGSPALPISACRDSSPPSLA